MSLVINMITRDAIIVGADSRMTATSQPDGGTAYRDTSPKVILGDDFIISHCDYMNAGPGLSVRSWIKDVIADCDDSLGIPDALHRRSQAGFLTLSEKNAVIFIARYLGDSPVVYRLDTAERKLGLELTGPGMAFDGMTNVASSIIKGSQYASLTKVDGVGLIRLALTASKLAQKYKADQGVGGRSDIVSLTRRGGIVTHSQSFSEKEVD